MPPFCLSTLPSSVYPAPVYPGEWDIFPCKLKFLSVK
jgi:hypothetical protein